MRRSVARRQPYEVHAGGNVTVIAAGRIGYERAVRIAERESKIHRHATITRDGTLIRRYYEGKDAGNSP